MWTGPVYLRDQMWPTPGHAIVTVTLEKATYFNKERIQELVLRCKDGFQANEQGGNAQLNTKYIRGTIVFDIFPHSSMPNLYHVYLILIL